MIRFIVLSILWHSSIFAQCGILGKQLESAFTEERIVANKKNRVFLLGGMAYNNKLYKTSSSAGTTYYLDFQPTFGIGYQRKINNDYNVGVIVQTNSAVFGTVGLDF